MVCMEVGAVYRDNKTEEEVRLISGLSGFNFIPATGGRPLWTNMTSEEARRIIMREHTFVRSGLSGRVA